MQAVCHSAINTQIVAITWNNVWILLIRTLETSFKNILSEIQAFQDRIWKCRREMAVILSQPQCVKKSTNNEYFQYFGAHVWILLSTDINNS